MPSAGVIQHSLPIDTIPDLVDRSYDERTIRVNEVECLVVPVDGIQCVIPRGTEFSAFIGGGGWRDVLRDIRFIIWKDRRVGWSHAGFVKGAAGIVDKGLFGVLDRNKPIAFYGHSLGGALAINAAKMLHWHGFNVIEVVTFGAPRTLTKGSVKAFKHTGIPITEYSNDGDPIVSLPIKGFVFKYRHINEVATEWESEHGPLRFASRIKANHLLPSYKEALLNNNNK